MAALRAHMRGANIASYADMTFSVRERLKQFLDAGRPIFFSKMKRPDDIPGEAKSEVAAFLASCRRVFWGMAAFSGLSNILMLTSSFFMLQVYDRVLPSRSVPTLVALIFLATALYVAQGVLDLIRSRISVRIGRHFDETLSHRIFDALARLPLKTRGDGDGLQPLRDLDQVRAFLSSGGPSAIFDLPWMPLYLGISFLFHFWIGTTALIGVVILIAITLLTELRTKTPAKAFAGFAMARNALALEARRNAEVLHAMGMRRQAAARWSDANRKYLTAHESANDVATGLGGISKVFRMILQSTVLAVGAYLVIHGEATAGIIIASSILTARALAPVDVAIANWKGLVAARQSAQRLNKLLIILPAEEERLALPSPRHSLTVDRLHVLAPGSEKRVINDISFALKSGQGLGIIGPSGSGKSSLARALVGVWTKVHGHVRLDNAPLEQWESDALGQHIGYLPQDVELFEGNVLSNIARFYPNATANAVLEAARAADVHDLILSFPDGYSTRIGEGGMALSAGQRQRIGLARALYGNPFLVVLDEPSSNLDAEGEGALTQAILNVRHRGGIAVVVAHRPKALDALDHVLAMADGKALCFGPRDQVLKKILRNPAHLMAVDNQAGGQ
jgi:ATP-binding cassette subfamily C protein